MIAIANIMLVCSCSVSKRIENAKSYQELAALSRSRIAQVYLRFKPLEVPGYKSVIYKDTKWKKSKSPYILEDNLLVIPGATLTIEPGVEVILKNDVRIKSQGIIIAKGTTEEPIVFRSPEADQYWDVITCVNATDAVTEGIYGTVVFEHCQIEGGRGIVINACNAIIRSNVFKNNVSSPIRMEFSGGEVIGNKIYNNTTERESESGNGAGIMVYTDQKVIVSENEVHDNISMGGRDGGGGIYAFAYDTGEITINDNIVRGNKSDRNGGGIVAYKCLVKHNIVEHNQTQDEGGGIYSVQCRVENNRVTNNTAGKGGGLYSYKCTVSNNLVQDNSAPENTGGGLYYYGEGTISDNTFIGNGDRVGKKGESIMISGGPTITRNNIIANFGYALRIQSHSLSPDMKAMNNFWGTTNEKEIKTLIYDWLDDSKIGIVCWKPYDSKLVASAYSCPKDADLRMNVSVRQLAPRELAGTIEKNLTIGGKGFSDYDIVGNLLVQEGVTLRILPGTSLSFLQNKSLRIRGKLISDGLKKKNILFTGKNNDAWDKIIFENRSVGDDGSVVPQEARSSLVYSVIEKSNGIVMDGKGANIDNCVIRNNYNTGITIREATSDITNSRIFGNKSPSNGGGIYVYGSKLVHISKNDIRDNIADEDGGGVFAYGYRSNTAVNLIDNRIENNQCGGDGGGVWASRSSLMDNEIISNKASSNGGGMYVTFALIVNNIIKNNYSEQGGGAFAETNSSFEKNSIIGNRINGELGGAAYLNFWGVSIKNEVFKNNLVEKNVSDTSNGNGGICLNGAMEFQHNIISNNSGIQLYNLNPSHEVPFEAENCYWGTNDEKKIEGFIFDGKDDKDLSKVEYHPFTKSRKDIRID